MLVLTLDAAALNWDELDDMSTRITNSVSVVNRVLVQLGGPEADQMHVHAAMPKPSRVALLQLADKIVHDALISSEWLGKVVQHHSPRSVDCSVTQTDQCMRDICVVQVWQFPVVLAPLSPQGSSDESIILRPVDSTEVCSMILILMECCRRHAESCVSRQ